jgi:hydroxypyruvate isomerase
MPKFAANLTMMFQEVPFMQRFSAAAKAGFKAVEYMFPYDYPAADIKKELTANNLQQVLFNLPAGNFAAGDRGIVSDPNRVAEFRDSVAKAISYAKELGVPRLNCMAGKKLADVSEEKQHATMVDNLRYAADVLAKAGIKLMVEPINYRDMPGFILNTSIQGFALLDEVNHPNLYLQYDIYHAQRLEGELVNTIEKNIARIEHIQLADNPGRHEPGTGEINYPFVFKAIDKCGYQGWIGCEYIPAAGTVEGLGWIAACGYKL